MSNCVAGGQARTAEPRATTDRARKRRTTVLVLALLGLLPVACLSDVPIPSCLDDQTCGNPAEGGAAGDSTAAAGDSGESPLAGGGGGFVNDAAPEGGAINPPVLPAPCATTAYSTRLRFIGGTAPYAWRVFSEVDGWQVAADPNESDSSFALLKNPHPMHGDVTVTVTDAGGHAWRQTYPMATRNACWFAYTALAADVPTLFVVDPILGTKPPTALTHTEGAYDFAFSPNGKFLSYRFGVDDEHERGAHLALVDLSTWEDRVLDLAGEAADPTVTAYAWSADSSTLAVAFSDGEDKYLGGVRLQTGEPSLTLTPTRVPVDSELYWVGLKHVAFYAKGTLDFDHRGELLPSPDGDVTAFYSELGASGFSPKVLSVDTHYAPEVVVRASAEGFYVLATQYMQFNAVPEQMPFAPFSPSSFLAPSGHFSAALVEDELVLYSNQANEALEFEEDPDHGCSRFLSWAAGRERMACVVAVPADDRGNSHSEVRIFDLQERKKLTMSPIQDYCHKNEDGATSCEALQYQYDQASADRQPRIFSPSGKWFAFATGSSNPDRNYLYLADLRQEPFTLKSKLAGTGNGSTAVSPSRISFSPDEQYLMRQLGTSLGIQNVETGSATWLTEFDADDAGTTTTCNEEFLFEPDEWCGSTTGKAPFTWSPDSKLAAYRGKSLTGPVEEGLTVADFAQFPTVDSHWFKAARCGTRCRGQFVFQPLIIE